MSKFIIISAPSGSGKSTLASHLLSNIPSLSFSVSSTTREKRKNEIHGKNYYFISSKNFKENINKEEQVAVVVEQVNAMPGQGVTSMFNFGQTFGALKGICAALELPIFFVRPSKWKKHFELINSSKDASRTKAIEMYPKLSNQLSKKKDVNKSDAILIARFFSETRLTEEI